MEKEFELEIQRALRLSSSTSSSDRVAATLEWVRERAKKGATR